MKLKSVLIAGVIAAGLGSFGLSSEASAKTLRYAFQGELKGLDPYTLNETFTLGALGNVYEGLIRRGPNLEIMPGLAERWETPEPTRWRFYLRKGVKFHSGADFNADDVLFSADRVRATGSDLRNRIPADAKFVKVDDHTIDVVLTTPNPILHFEWDTWYIMDKEWAESNGSGAPTPPSATTPSFASLNANGTGPFKIESHQAGVRTVYKPNASWWEKPQHNLTEVIFTPISSDATRVAALLSGEVDWIDPVPLQDAARVNSSGAAMVMAGPETRTIFLGFDQKRDELLFSSVKGKNPFKDIRVRKAFYQAIDVEAIKDRVMRGQATPSALMISPLFFKAHADSYKRLPLDVEGAKKLLAEAGYPDGFEVTMDCPNDRYVNDEAICQATVAMLARIGIKVNLNAQTKSKYFAQVLAAGGFKTSFFLLGWTPGSFDSWNVLFNLHNCRDDAGKGSPVNLGGYCNPKVDELTKQILVETDTVKRDMLIKQAFDITTADVSYIPLHQQNLSWGVSKSLKVAQRADNQFLFNYVTKN